MTDFFKHRDYAESVLGEHKTFHRGNCPFCGGKNTFTATSSLGSIAYNCYKLGCSVGGVFDIDMTAKEVMQRLRPAQEEPDKEPDTMVIPEYVVDLKSEYVLHHQFIDKWDVGHVRTLYDIKDHRVVFPVYYKGRIIDAIGRAVKGAIPKWYRYTGKADYYTLGEGTGTLLIVEDVLSAIIAHKRVPSLTSMAILGTNLSSKAIEKCGEFSKVIVALDPDASSKTIEFKKTIQAWTGLPTYAMRLQDDIKYCVEEDIEHLRSIANDKIL